MKQTIIVALFLIIGLTGYSQADSVSGRQLLLTGKIIEKIQLTPHCGTIAWGTVLEFKVINLVGMTYPGKKIGIIITCPELYKDNFFQKGNTCQVVFSDKNQASFEWTIPNRDILKKYGLSFEPYAISIKKIP